MNRTPRLSEGTWVRQKGIIAAAISHVVRALREEGNFNRVRACILHHNCITISFSINNSIGILDFTAAWQRPSGYWGMAAGRGGSWVLDRINETATTPQLSSLVHMKYLSHLFFPFYLTNPEDFFFLEQAEDSLAGTTTFLPWHDSTVFPDGPGSAIGPKEKGLDAALRLHGVDEAITCMITWKKSDLCSQNGT